MPISESYLHGQLHLRDELKVQGLGEEFVTFRQPYH
jgi:hypothetical protein